MIDTEYEPFKFSRQAERETEKRQPVVFEAERFFDVATLLFLTGAFFVGWAIGHMVHRVFA